MMTKNIIKWNKKHEKLNKHAFNQLNQTLKSQFIKKLFQTTFIVDVLFYESMIMLNKKIFKIY